MNRLAYGSQNSSSDLGAATSPEVRWKPSSLPRRIRPHSCIRRWPGFYRAKVTEIAKALQEPDSRSEATEALRGLVDAIVLTPDQGGETFQIELRGNLAAMLGATSTNEEVAGFRRPLPATIFGCGGSKPPVLAVERGAA